MPIERLSSEGRARVLLVDDHPLLRHGMRAIIDGEPDLIVSGEAEGVRSALEEIGRVRPDVVVVDLSIIDGDGLGLIRQIRQGGRNIGILVLSMHDEMIYAERALRAGALGYIMKARAANSVLDGIRAVLRGEVVLSEEVRAKFQVPPGTGGGLDGAAALSDRELQVLRLIGNGLGAREIGEALFISPKTVEAHRENIKHKLGLGSSGELLRYAIEHNRLYG